jgi:hypothetical protein
MEQIVDANSDATEPILGFSTRSQKYFTVDSNDFQNRHVPIFQGVVAKKS